MTHIREREAAVEADQRTTWLCASCRAAIGAVTLGPETSSLMLETRHIAARITLPVTHLCGRCGATNHIGPADLACWRRRGGARPLLAAWPPPPSLARPA